jgi:hypothetical protein
LTENVGIPSCVGGLASPVGAPGVLVASNSPSFRRVAKFSAISSSSSTVVSPLVSHGARGRIVPNPFQLRSTVAFDNDCLNVVGIRGALFKRPPEEEAPAAVSVFLSFVPLQILKWMRPHSRDINFHKVTMLGKIATTPRSTQNVMRTTPPHSPSCGCLRREMILDILGKGHLWILDKHFSKSADSQVRGRCSCDAGGR